MKILLDTHTFLWWLDGNKNLPAKIRNLMQDDSHKVFVSAASAWETTTKFRLGKLPGAKDVAADFGTCIIEQGFIALPISISHAELAGSLKGTHRDPFDRMLVAQAKEEKMVLASNEKIFDDFEIERIW